VEGAKGPILGSGLGLSSANYECFRLGGNYLQKISTDRGYFVVGMHPTPLPKGEGAGAPAVRVGIGDWGRGHLAIIPVIR
jgi:hypothetical protein